MYRSRSTRSKGRKTGGDLDAEAIKQANKRKRDDGQRRCYAHLKGSTTRCLQVSSAESDFCQLHGGWEEKISEGVQGYSRFNDSDDDEEGRGKEDDRPDARKKKKKKKPKQKRSKRKNEGEEKEDDGRERFSSLPLPGRLTSVSSEIESLDAISAALDYVPVNDKGANPRPGLVASVKEVKEISAINSWEELAQKSHCPNLQTFFAPEVKDLIPPNHEVFFPRILRAITSQQVVVDSCFGSDSKSLASLCLLLGKISHTRKTTPMLQLEEILEILRHISLDHADLSGAAAQKLWIRDPTTSLVDPEKILESFSTNVAEALAFALIQPCIDAREAGEDIFGLNLSYPRCLLFLAPSGNGTLGHLQKLFQLSPFGDLKVDSATQSLFNSGDWTTTEVYADMLERHLCRFDNTVKGMAESEEGWASQPVIPRIRDASMKDLAFYVKSITSAIREREPPAPQKHDQDDECRAATGGVGPTRVSKAPSWAIPKAEEMFTRDRRPKKRTEVLAPLPGATSTTTGSAVKAGSPGNSNDTADGRVRPMTTAERGRAKRELAIKYSGAQGTSAFEPSMLEAIIQNKGDDTRYDKRLNAPAAGAKTHFYRVVRKRCRQLGIALSDAQIDYLLQRQLSRVNFNLFERYTANMKLESTQKTQKQQLPALGFTTLLHQFTWFQDIFGLVVGPIEAAAIVGFWKRELNTMREEECVD